ncbi:DUF485 domain-containing protein [Kitasatospora sp. GP82]|uniref:DUF485 domain-containing protein n=1 Tax=Kitasatospora sp. GP82 TaxID=3035089 RepID=UPI00247593F4|nr:DUF485 domain-containing protein [Kitasatospora sp. GP82]MDH6129442.1 uncharacterized membrane protein (DUF485 family) [Kitasatospora sp. GP82]
MDTPPADEAAPPEAQRADESEEFRSLRASFRGFAFPVTAGFILWYLLYVLLSSYAPAFMATKVFGHVNVALVLGLLQFASTFAIAAWYARFADRRLDPAATAIRESRQAADRAGRQDSAVRLPQEAAE